MAIDYHIQNFEDLVLEDFEKYVGKKDIIFTLKKSFTIALEKARNKIDKMLDDNYYRCRYNESQFERLHKIYIKLAEVEFKWRTCKNNIGSLVLVGFIVSGIADEVKELEETIKKEIKDKVDKEWEDLGEDYDD